MVADWCKYLLVGVGAYVVGRMTGISSACRNPELCELMEHHFRHHRFHIPGIDGREDGYIEERIS